MPAGSVGSGVNVGEGATVAVGEGAAIGVIVATGDSRGAVGVAGAVIGEAAGRSGAAAGDVGLPVGSSVVRIGVGAVPVVVSGKRAFVMRRAKIASAAPITATPIQLYLLRGGGAVRAGGDPDA